jgi:hypothetical protein
MTIQDRHEPAGDAAGEPGAGSDRKSALGAPLEPEPDAPAADENVAKHEFEHALRTAFTKP